MKYRAEIPNEFMKRADFLGIPKEFAVEIFIRKTAKKGLDDLIYKMVNQKVFKTEKDARIAVRDLWKEHWRSLVAPTSSKRPRKKEMTSITTESYSEWAWEGLIRAIGQPSPFKPSGKRSEDDRVAIAGDFHWPFCDLEAFNALLKDPARILVIVADFFDMYSVGRYRKTLDHIKVREELALGSEAMRRIAENFSKVFILKGGNHDERPARRLQEFCPELLPLLVHPVDVITKDLPNVEIINTVVPNTAPIGEFASDVELNFFSHKWGAIFGHFENFCGDDAATRAEKWLGEWSHVLNLPDGRPKAVFQGHSHRLNMTYSPNGTLLVNTGCMCKPMPYQFEDHGKYQPPTIGYVVTYLDKGKIDPRNTFLVPLK